MIQVPLITFTLVTVITSYTLVFRHVREHSKKMRNHPVRNIASTSQQSHGKYSTTRGTTSRNETGQPSQRQQKGFSKVDLDVTKNLLIMVVAFFLCFMPYNIVTMNHWSYSITLYTVLLVYVSSCINPVIYCRRHPHFKVVLRALIKCQYQNIPEPSGILKRLISRRINLIQ